MLSFKNINQKCFEVINFQCDTFLFQSFKGIYLTIRFCNCVQLQHHCKTLSFHLKRFQKYLLTSVRKETKSEADIFQLQTTKVFVKRKDKQKCLNPRVLGVLGVERVPMTDFFNQNQDPKQGKYILELMKSGQVKLGQVSSDQVKRIYQFRLGQDK